MFPSITVSDPITFIDPFGADVVSFFLFDNIVQI